MTEPRSSCPKCMVHNGHMPWCELGQGEEQLELNERLASGVERIALELVKIGDKLERIAEIEPEAFTRGYARGNAAQQQVIDHLTARVLELQREIGERNMADDREKADTTVGGRS